MDGHCKFQFFQFPKLMRKVLALFIMCTKVSISNAFAYFSILKLAFAFSNKPNFCLNLKIIYFD